VKPNGFSPGWWGVEQTFVDISTNIYNDTSNDALIASSSDTSLTAIHEIKFTRDGDSSVRIDNHAYLLVYHDSDTLP